MQRPFIAFLAAASLTGGAMASSRLTQELVVTNGHWVDKAIEQAQQPLPAKGDAAECIWQSQVVNMGYFVRTTARMHDALAAAGVGPYAGAAPLAQPQWLDVPAWAAVVKRANEEAVDGPCAGLHFKESSYRNIPARAGSIATLNVYRQTHAAMGEMALHLGRHTSAGRKLDGEACKMAGMFYNLSRIAMGGMTIEDMQRTDIQKKFLQRKIVAACGPQAE